MEHLSKREREVASLVALGMSNRQISLHLAIAEKTVKNHITNVFKTMEIKSRAQLIVKWLDKSA